MRGILAVAAAVAIAAASLASPLRAEGAEPKFAVVDMQRIFKEYEKTKMIEQKLEQQAEVYRETAKQMLTQYQNMRKQYENARDDAQNIALSDAERENRTMRMNELKDKLDMKEREIREYNVTRQQKLKEMGENSRTEVLDEIRKTIINKSILQGYTLVLDKSGHSLNDTNLVVFHAPSLDITDEILRDLNRGYRKNAGNPVAAPTKSGQTK